MELVWLKLPYVAVISHVVLQLPHSFLHALDPVPLVHVATRPIIVGVDKNPVMMIFVPNPSPRVLILASDQPPFALLKPLVPLTLIEVVIRCECALTLPLIFNPLATVDVTTALYKGAEPLSFTWI